MSECLKIAVIGDFNFTYNSHHATNMALEHSERYLEVELSYYWIRPSEAVNMRPHTFSVYDGILIAPGPYFNEFFLSGVLGQVINLNTPEWLIAISFCDRVDVTNGTSLSGNRSLTRV